VGLAGGGIDQGEWVSITRIFSLHWYPVDYGLFGTEHQERFVPFLGFALLLLYYAPRARQRPEADRKLLSGMLAMLVLGATGILLSWLAPAPFFVKMSLHRATLLFAFVGMIYVIAGLWQELQSRSKVRVALAAAVLTSPFLLKPGFPSLLAILLALPSWKLALQRDSSTRHADLAVIALSAGTLLLLAWYGAQGWIESLLPGAYLGGKWVLAYAVAVFLTLWVVRPAPSWSPAATKFVNAAAIFAICVAALMSISYPIFRREATDGAPEYLKTQLWAREHTAPNALFMVDPTIFYGWRDFSRRSSFGNLREWLYTSWLYDSRADRYREGRRRFEELGIPLQPYLAQTPSSGAFWRLADDVRLAFYSKPCDWQLDLARRYKIDYFVLRRDIPARSHCLPISYQNDGFVILKVPD
jgi:hypothetical protein